ncbi:MAG: nucleotide exchange factor GrpE [Anaerolineales bacterium]|nr:nucleotide exchange factor GrpE [Anaerolineales bacterium]
MSNKKSRKSIEDEQDVRPVETEAEAKTPAPEVGEQASEEPVSEENVEALQAELEQYRSQAAEFKDGWQRALADFQNYKRRVENEKSETYRIAAGDILKRYLAVMDDLERALAVRPADLAWANGIELIYRKLQTILENEGLQRIEAEGQMFDPNFHEAVSQEPVAGMESGTVIEVLQHGYMLGERVLRPAMVRVAQ